MLADIASPEKPLIGEQIGSYNRKFYEKYGKLLIKAFGDQAKNVQQLDQKKYLALLQKMNASISEGVPTLGQGYDKLSTYSEWLDMLDCNDFYNQVEYIELPG